GLASSSSGSGGFSISSPSLSRTYTPACTSGESLPSAFVVTGSHPTVTMASVCPGPTAGSWYAIDVATTPSGAAGGVRSSSPVPDGSLAPTTTSPAAL